LNCRRTDDAAAGFLRSSSCVPNRSREATNSAKQRQLTDIRAVADATRGGFQQLCCLYKTKPLMFVATQHPHPSRSQVTLASLLLTQSTCISPAFTVVSVFVLVETEDERYNVALQQAMTARKASRGIALLFLYP